MVTKPVQSQTVQIQQKSTKKYDGFYIEFYIDGVSVPVTSNNLDISIIENIKTTVPSCQFNYKDTLGLFNNKLTIGDGTRIRVALAKDDIPDLTISDFYVFGAPKIRLDGSGYILSGVAILNALAYLRGKPFRSYSDTSRNVLKKLATECKLGFKGDPSNDKQIWLNAGNVSYSQFSQHIIGHGWYDSKSCFLAGLTEKGVFKYCNLSNLYTKNPIVKFSMAPTLKKSTIPTYLIMQYKINNNAGLMNNIIGYGGNSVEQNVLKSSASQFDTINISRFSHHTELSSDILNSNIDLKLNNFQTVNCGNVHRNYAAAAYQNKRLKSLWSTSIEILVNDYTDVSLFDVINCEILDSVNNTVNKIYSGDYMVSAKTRILRNGNYYEKLCLVTQGRQDHILPLSKVI